MGYSVPESAKIARKIPGALRGTALAFALSEHRRYRKDGTWIMPTGTAFVPDGGWRIVNWPNQNYDNV